MRGQTRTLAVIALIIALTVPYTLGHSYLTNPISRSNQRQSNAGCRGPTCMGPCEVNKANARTPAVNIQRGQSISVEWPRNNHAGGFIRLAWAKFDQSDSHSAFDDNVQEIVCHEIGGCGPDDASNPNGGDSGPADGSSRACKSQLTVPKHLADGKWTLQWAWYGGAFALSDYYSCVDYNIAGGPTGSRPNPTFRGGDYANPGKDKCKYFNTDALHVCTSEPCLNPPRPGEHSGVPANTTLWGNSKPSSSTSGSTSTSTSSSSSSGGNTNPTTTPTSNPPTAPTTPTNPTTPPTVPPTSGTGGSSSGGSSGSDGCIAGTILCDSAPESTADYQCCASGAQCFASGGRGVCCGPYTVGCIYGSGATKNKSACCDSRFLKCDGTQGCIPK